MLCVRQMTVPFFQLCLLGSFGIARADARLISGICASTLSMFSPNTSSSHGVLAIVSAIAAMDSTKSSRSTYSTAPPKDGR